MKTDDNLKKAFAGESQASRKYTYFSEKAMEEGFKNVSRLFKAASFSETIHAKKHLITMDGLNTTRQNLQEAISGENEEHTTMYPNFTSTAENEGNKEAALSFKYANEAEKAHESFYKNALESVENNEDMDDIDIWVCKGCGYTMQGNAPDNCPVCGAPKTMFKEF